ncbi:hypothetical protein [Actinoplanes rectilineatus]|uniref:hypothetical protein n=1 Tax=Actinoplanes rectilineatus TaxID=113571 RepID=UPI0005F2A85E|nr:hypothetical protein [Actinoplanes rectilineatus]
MPTQVHDQATGTFLLVQPGQVVTFVPANRSIGIHSASPHGNLPPHPHNCEYVDGDAYCDGSFSAGNKLRELWENSGHNDQIIWDELAIWFGANFPAVHR